MASQLPAIKNQPYTFSICLPSQAETRVFQVNPTITADDFKIVVSGVEQPLTNTPAVTPAGSRWVEVSLTASEMNQDRVLFLAHDNAGGEWSDVSKEIYTVARNIDNLAFPTVSGRGILVDGTGKVDANISLPSVIDSNIVQVAGNTEAATALGSGSRAVIPLTCVTGTLSATGCTTNLSESTDNHYIDRTITWITGALKGQSGKIVGYDGITKLISYENGSGDPLTDAPSNGDLAVIA